VASENWPNVADPDYSYYLSRHRFFGDGSPWNTQISQDAKYVPSTGIASYPAGLTSWLPHGGSIAIYFAHSSDPLVAILENRWTETQVKRGAWQRVGNSAAVERQILASSTVLNPFPGNPYSTQTHGSTFGSNHTLPAQYNAYHQLSPLLARVPAGAAPPWSSDGHTVIVQPDGMAVEMYSPIVLSSEEWVAEMYSLIPTG
jgi:hypothetical protein